VLATAQGELDRPGWLRSRFAGTRTRILAAFAVLAAASTGTSSRGARKISARGCNSDERRPFV